MKIPLKVQLMKNKLMILSQNRWISVNFPFKPYIYSDTESTPRGTTSAGSTQMYNLSSQTLIDVYKYEVKNPKDIWKIRTIGKRYVIDYLSQIFIDRPDFFLQYPHNTELKILYFDIEIATDGSSMFPTSDKYPILCIGYAINKNPIQTIWSNSNDDKKTLGIFLEMIEKERPNIIVGYNSNSFDIPYIVERCMIHSSRKLKNLCRNIFNKKSTDGKYEYLYGCSFDIFVEVMKDQSLSGIKNHQMKTVAEWYKINAVRLDDKDIGNLISLPHSQVQEYIDSDIYVTREESKIYLPKVISLAEFMQVPLNTMINAPNNFCPKIFSARHLRDRNYVSFDRNIDRYNWIQKKDGEESKKYEGAIVGVMNYCPNCSSKVFIKAKQITKCNACGRENLNDENTNPPGFVKKLWKIDFKSMYPSAQITLDLSPETCLLYDDQPITKDLIVKKQDNALWLSIPDTNLERNFNLRIDKNRDGFCKIELLKLFEKRAQLKKLQKQSNNETEKEMYNSQQNSIKVILNTTYGYNGQIYSQFGDISVAIGVVGFCRWVTSLVMEWLGDSIIEVDTDGIMVDNDYFTDEFCKEVIDRINKTLINSKPSSRITQEVMNIEGEDKVKQLTNVINTALSIVIDFTFGCKSYMILEPEEYESGYIYRAKNYALKEGEKIVKHGVSFKASSKCKIYDKAMDTICENILNENPNMLQIIEELKNLEQYDLSDFALSTKLSQDVEKYTNQNACNVKLAYQMNEKMNYMPKAGDTIYYVKSIEPDYTILSHASLENIDKDYYISMIENIQEIFNLRRLKARKLIGF